MQRTFRIPARRFGGIIKRRGGITVSLFVGMTFVVSCAAIPGMKNGTQKEIWVAMRTDGKIGAGTSKEPFNGATLGDIIDNLPAGTTVHLAAGQDYPLTWKAWNQNGLKIRGAGKEKTTIKNTSSNPTGRTTNAWIYWSFYGDDIELSDLTIDCNTSLNRNQKITVGGVRLHGNNSSLRRMKVLNPRGVSSVGECFAMGIAAVKNRIQNPIIENCEVAYFTGDSGTMIIVGTDSNFPGVVAIGGYTTGCHVHDCPTAIAYGSGGNRGYTFADNLAEDVRYGYNRDTYESTGTRITNNVFRTCHQYGIVFRGATPANACTEDVIENNRVSLTGERSDATGISLPDEYQTKETVRGNTVVCEITPPKGAESYHLRGGAGWIISGNKEQTGFTHLLSTKQGAIVSANVQDDGKPWVENNSVSEVTVP